MSAILDNLPLELWRKIFFDECTDSSARYAFFLTCRRYWYGDDEVPHLPCQARDGTPLPDVADDAIRHGNEAMCAQLSHYGYFRGGTVFNPWEQRIAQIHGHFDLCARFADPEYIVKDTVERMLHGYEPADDDKAKFVVGPSVYMAPFEDIATPERFDQFIRRFAVDNYWLVNREACKALVVRPDIEDVLIAFSKHGTTTLASFLSAYDDQKKVVAALLMVGRPDLIVPYVVDDPDPSPTWIYLYENHRHLDPSIVTAALCDPTSVSLQWVLDLARRIRKPLPSIRMIETELARIHKSPRSVLRYLRAAKRDDRYPGIVNRGCSIDDPKRLITHFEEDERFSETLAARAQTTSLYYYVFAMSQYVTDWRPRPVSTVKRVMDAFIQYLPAVAVVVDPEQSYEHFHVLVNTILMARTVSVTQRDAFINALPPGAVKIIYDGARAGEYQIGYPLMRRILQHPSAPRLAMHEIFSKQHDLLPLHFARFMQQRRNRPLRRQDIGNYLYQHSKPGQILAAIKRGQPVDGADDFLYQGLLRTKYMELLNKIKLLLINADVYSDD